MSAIKYTIIVTTISGVTNHNVTIDEVELNKFICVLKKINKAEYIMVEDTIYNPDYIISVKIVEEGKVNS